MKDPLLKIASAAVIVLLLAGIYFLAYATRIFGYIAVDSVKPALVSGITCLVIGAGLLVFAVLTLRNHD